VLSLTPPLEESPDKKQDAYESDTAGGALLNDLLDLEDSKDSSLSLTSHKKESSKKRTFKQLTNASLDVQVTEKRSKLGESSSPKAEQ
jgi:hypothetical protein